MIAISRMKRATYLGVPCSHKMIPGASELLALGRMIGALVALGLAASAAASATTEHVRCAIDDGPDFPCHMADTVLPDGSHHLIFTGGTRRIEFSGRSQTRWWSGRLNGAAAMGYERNRGNVVLASLDLRMRFAWWYPTDAHGRY